MIAGIADTHTAIWYLFSDPRLGRAASDFIDATIVNGDHIGISAISLAEMIYLIEKKRIPANALEDVLAAIADPKIVLQEVPLDSGIVVKMKQFPREEIPDLPDRIIAATAQFYSVPVLSRDGPNPVVCHQDRLVKASETTGNDSLEFVPQAEL
jgi:PIN domain nuclease of toxin-antitoxin system